MSQSPRWLSVLLWSSAAFFATEQIATACPCPGLMDPPLLPEDGSMSVPLNTRIWISADWVPSPEDITVVDQNDKDVDLTFTTLRVADDPKAPGVHAFETEGLRPNQGYSIKVGESVVSSFWTGHAADETMPTLPAVLDRDRTIDPGNNAPCPGPTYLATFEVDHEPGLLVVDRDGTAAIQAGVPAGLVTTLSPRRHVSIGRSPCFENWPDAAESARTRIRFGVYDLAGNFSGWTEYEEVLIQPENEALACSVDPSPRLPGWLGLAGMLWIVARRRN